ncbi:rhodanese-related sulfurtransferase [Synechococcus sp. PCC 7335]|uniref:oxygen-dependent tRNA uridine(34) hydroxylase TrhO n=1 Tax=Synechococcus sp. (strain ATCC 29403 / PCC 7335) TaxID=91464 RepID=UPI00056DD547
MSVTVATFYKFADLNDYADLQLPLRDLCEQQQVKGTILLAAEGINGTIAGTHEGIDTVLAYICTDSRLASLDIKKSSASKLPFEKLKVRLKKEIVTIGLPELNPTQQVGTYVSAKAWNEIIADPEVTVIDTRNNYEVGMGTFQGANNPQTEVFNEFPDYVKENLDPKKNKKVAMFCTGGIRCEKASSYMLAQGFEEVYHLKGGILKYLEEVPEEESLWKGECFVFDERVAIKHGLEPGTYAMCYACGHPVSRADQHSADYESEVSCPHCIKELTKEKRDRLRERKRQRHLNANKNNASKI